eukprot:130998-Rhodomonas_salina.1
MRAAQSARAHSAQPWTHTDAQAQERERERERRRAHSRCGPWGQREGARRALPPPTDAAPSSADTHACLLYTSDAADDM